MSQLGGCNDRLKTLLQISEDTVQLVRERKSAGKSETNAMCLFWRQAGRVFTALSMVWNCNCRAQHSTRLLLEHRTISTSDFHLVYDSDPKTPREARRLRITAKSADFDNSPLIKLSLHKAVAANVATNEPTHRASTPFRSAMKKTAGSNTIELRYEVPSISSKTQANFYLDRSLQSPSQSPRAVLQLPWPSLHPQPMPSPASVCH